ncbi:serine hydrolase domain-containing protein [Azorhizobium doebereinerae]|uniref:serine hydrolase domain-containing protein n=1 Tax=Azorhizobium doebereinerae TaxID=281091 RepID=UPI000422EF69|nr:serine hydrolase domain-containing protein [Azorhizobium doebereinerae]
MTTIVEPTEAQLKALVEPYLDGVPDGVSLGFAIGIASPTFSTIYTFGGLRMQDGTALAFDADTPFVIASVTKTFTATAYAYYLDGEDLENAVLGDYPELEIGSQFAQIPLTTLVNYTSGLPQDNGAADDEPANMPQPYTIPGMLGFLNYTTMGPFPEPAYRYSNLGFALMGAVMPTLAGTDDPYEQIVVDLIFEPLGLSAQFFDEVRLDTLPRGYFYNGQTYNSIAAPGWPQFTAYNAAGGIVATPDDMLKWLCFNMSFEPQSPLSPLLGQLQTASTTVTTPWGDQLGLAWFLTPASDTTFATVWKDGDLPGFSSYIAFLPSETPGVAPAPGGVFVLSNTEGMTDSNGTEICASLANDILYLMQGLTPPDDKTAYPRSKR